MYKCAVSACINFMTFTQHHFRREGLANGSIRWYSEPLDADDLFAGLFLILFALIFVPLYTLVAYVMFRDDKEIIGFRYLFSAAIADILLMINYGIVPGMSILLKSQLIAPSTRHWLQIYLDWAWFSMCYHYSLISWSRFAAIRSPHSFRTQSRCLSYTLCAGCYVLALIQVLCTHFRSWYVTFYYEPSAYGMLSEDFNKYLEEGQSTFFMSFHVIVMIIPFFFYTWSIWLLMKQRRNGVTMNRRKFSVSSTITKSKTRIEIRLILPCICNAIVFTIGQVLMTLGTGEGKWATWSVMVLFSTNSAVNPVLLIFFSAVIRKRLMHFLCSLAFNSKSFTAPLFNNNNSAARIPSPMIIRCPSSAKRYQQTASLLEAKFLERTTVLKISSPISNI